MPMTTTAASLFGGVRRTAAVMAAAAALAACTSGGGDPLEGIGFREARFEQISMMRDYRACRDEGIELDKQARLASSAGAYLASARLLEKCEAEMGPSGAGIAVDERISAYALSIQNYFKSGDVEHARANLDKFKRAFPDNDLYYPDGTSFTVTMEAVLGRREVWTFGEFAALNVNRTLKSEMRRLHYWKNK